MMISLTYKTMIYFLFQEYRTEMDANVRNLVLVRESELSGKKNYFSQFILYSIFHAHAATLKGRKKNHKACINFVVYVHS